MTRKQIESIFFFGVAGVAGYLVDVSVTVLLEPLLGAYMARIPAFILAATATWLLNRSLAFKSRKSRHTSIYKEYFHYLSLMLSGLIINYTAYAVAIASLPEGVYKIYVAVGIGGLAGMLVNYLFSRKYIYSETRDS